MIRNQKDHITIRVEDNFGASTDCLFVTKQQVLVNLHQQIEKLYEGSIISMFIFKENKNQPSSFSENGVEEEASNSNAIQYQVDLLKQQILLFDRDQDMKNFIETEKCLAENCIQQLTDLSFSLMKLCKELTSNRKPICDLSFKQDNFTREKLDKIESECLATLVRVRQERKRIESCCVCLLNRSNMVVLPCMHMVLCKDCVGPVSRCPICMRPITEIHQIFQ